MKIKVGQRWKFTNGYCEYIAEITKVGIVSHEAKTVHTIRCGKSKLQDVFEFDEGLIYLGWEYLEGQDAEINDKAYWDDTVNKVEQVLNKLNINESDDQYVIDMSKKLYEAIAKYKK